MRKARPCGRSAPLDIRYPVSQKVLDAICDASEGRLFNAMGDLYLGPKEDLEAMPCTSTS